MRQVGPSSEAYTVSDTPPGSRSYCHFPGSFRTRTQCICQWLSHSKTALSRCRRGLHHEVGSTRQQWALGWEMVEMEAHTPGSLLFQILELESPHPDSIHISTEHSLHGNTLHILALLREYDHRDSSRSMFGHSEAQPLRDNDLRCSHVALKLRDPLGHGAQILSWWFHVSWDLGHLGPSVDQDTAGCCRTPQWPVCSQVHIWPLGKGSGLYQSSPLVSL